METFKIEIKEFLSKVIEVKSENIEEAISKVRELYKKEQITLEILQIMLQLKLMNINKNAPRIIFS